MNKWKEITELNEWQSIWEASNNQPAIILKHSTTCPVSASALEEFESYLSDTPSDKVDYYMVKVIESRPVSNQIAEDSGVKHASPQILYIKDKHAEWNTSHWSVTQKHISAVLD